MGGKIYVFWYSHSAQYFFKLTKSFKSLGINCSSESTPARIGVSKYFSLKFHITMTSNVVVPSVSHSVSILCLEAKTIEMRSTEGVP